MADGPAETAIPKLGFGGGGAKILDRALRRLRTGAIGEMPRKPFEVRERCRIPNTTPGEAN